MNSVMRKAAIVFIGILISVCAFGGTCGKPGPALLPESTPPLFTIVVDKKHAPAFQAVGFWEFHKKVNKEFVVDMFFLGTDPADKETHLYVHELIPPNTGLGWREFPELLTGCNQLPKFSVNGDWNSPGDYTRRVTTGSGAAGLKGKGKTSAPTCSGFSYQFCGHSDELSYDFGP